MHHIGAEMPVDSFDLVAVPSFEMKKAQSSLAVPSFEKKKGRTSLAVPSFEKKKGQASLAVQTCVMKEEVKMSLEMRFEKSTFPLTSD